MNVSWLLLAVVVSSGVGQSIREESIEKQNMAFQRWWGSDFVWKFDRLPLSASVATERVPYSGYIYPDNRGGTASTLRKYDVAFNAGNMRATGWEQWDTTAYQRPTQQAVRGGFLRGRVSYRTVYATPGWHGHCNGWTAAAIRHAEPQKSVTRNGVHFTPADIKALLAEIYMYNDTLMLAGDGGSIHPGVLHAILGNWLGRGLHPVAMEAEPSEEKWNYPIYAYQSTIGRRSANRVEVRTTITYAGNSNGEFQQSPRLRRTRYFHYELQLDDAGSIVGGSYYRDSSQIDMLWVPLGPKEPGQPGNQRGNPHVSVAEVLAMWRESTSDELRNIWPIVDAPAQERLLASNANASAEATLVPNPSVDLDAESHVDTEPAGERANTRSDAASPSAAAEPAILADPEVATPADPRSND
jgi:hypothetical protein